MAARTNLRQQEQTRAAIQTTQLVKRLQDYALGTGDIDIEAGRLKAIEILLRKSLPDLSSVSLTGDPDHPVAYEKIERVVVDPKHSNS